MKLSEAKDGVLTLIARDAEESKSDIKWDPTPTARDEGKFTIEGKVARVIQPYDGFSAKINLSWFEGSMDMPSVKRERFYWYVFSLRPDSGPDEVTSYYICDYISLRRWVLSFEAPAGETHQDNKNWRGQIHYLPDNKGYFRWGDEPTEQRRASRILGLRNIEKVAGGKAANGSSQGNGNQDNNSSDNSGGTTYTEGRAKDVNLTRYERNRAARRKCIEEYGASCCACKTNFEETYGDIGKGYIHVHHLVPLSKRGEEYKVDPVEDLRPVCPNCHAMIHASDPPYSLEEIRSRLSG